MVAEQDVHNLCLQFGGQLGEHVRVLVGQGTNLLFPPDFLTASYKLAILAFQSRISSSCLSFAAPFLSYIVTEGKLGSVALLRVLYVPFRISSAHAYLGK